MNAERIRLFWLLLSLIAWLAMFILLVAWMESGVEFVAVDMPEANRLTIHILTTVGPSKNRIYQLSISVENLPGF